MTDPDYYDAEKIESIRANAQLLVDDKNADSDLRQAMWIVVELCDAIAMLNCRTTDLMSINQGLADSVSLAEDQVVGVNRELDGIAEEVRTLLPHLRICAVTDTWSRSSPAFTALTRLIDRFEPDKPVPS